MQAHLPALFHPFRSQCGHRRCRRQITDLGFLESHPGGGTPAEHGEGACADLAFLRVLLFCLPADGEMWLVVTGHGLKWRGLGQGQADMGHEHCLVGRTVSQTAG